MSNDPKRTCTKPLLDHLVGATKHRERRCDAERLGGFEVQDQFHFRGVALGNVHSPGVHFQRAIFSHCQLSRQLMTPKQT